MENRKDIGGFIRQKIDLLDKTSNNDGWDAIQSKLDKKRKKRLIFIPFWFENLGLFTAGSLCLWLILNHSFKNETLIGTDANSSGTKSTHITTNGKNTDSTTLQKSIKYGTAAATIPNAAYAIDSAFSSKGSFIHKNSNQNSNNINAMKLVSNSSNTSFNKRKRSEDNKTNKPVIKISVYNNKKSRSHKIKVANQNSKKIINSKRINSDKTSNAPSSMEKALVADSQILEQNNLEQINYQKKNKKVIIKTTEVDTITTPKIVEKSFELFVYGSPTLSGLNKNKSLLDDRLINNTNSSNITFSYGAYLCYQGTTNFSLRLGLGIINHNLITDNVPVNTTDYSKITYASGFSNAYIYTQSNTSEHMKITQKISYIEVPLEVKYRFINQKIDINAIVGLNYLFLNNNEVIALTTNGNQFKTGKTKDLLDRTFGVNVGLGFDYNLTKKIKLNFEPMFKYNFKNSQNNDEAKLLSLNILTGVQIKFGK